MRLNFHLHLGSEHKSHDKSGSNEEASAEHSSICIDELINCVRGHYHDGQY